MISDKYVVQVIAALIREWQEDGRNEHCMPVIRGELLEILEQFADEFTRENCSWCHGNGDTCPHCKPLFNA